MQLVAPFKRKWKILYIENCAVLFSLSLFLPLRIPRFEFFKYRHLLYLNVRSSERFDFRNNTVGYEKCNVKTSIITISLDHAYTCYKIKYQTLRHFSINSNFLRKYKTNDCWIAIILNKKKIGTTRYDQQLD